MLMAPICAKVDVEMRVHREPVIRFDVHVHPGSRQASASGSYDGALSVHVRARAVNGAATSDVLKVLTGAFAVRASDVRLVRGAQSRTKTVEIDGDEAALRTRLNELLGGL